MERGFVQVYTGNGKGKTTAALGQALRAVGAGLRVYIGQFLKDDDYSEIKALSNKFSDREITVRQFGAGKGFVPKTGAISEEHLAAAKEGLTSAYEALTVGGYDVVILDEINVAVHMKLITAEDVLWLINAKPDGVELILTGRYACEAVINAADLVTEMKLVKHYFSNGVIARTGIEK